MDIINCESKMKKHVNSRLSKRARAVLRGSSQQERLLHRLHSVALVLNGLSASEVARMFGDSPRAVSYWVERFKTNDVEGLKEEARPGRPSRLTSRQLNKLQSFVADSYKAEQPATARIIADYLSKKFRVSLTIRQCERIRRRIAAQCDFLAIVSDQWRHF